MARRRSHDDHTARRRALHAARAVTMGLALTGAGCASSHGPGKRDGSMPRDSMPRDATADATADGGTCPDAAVEATTEECCEKRGGFWNEDECVIAVPGPFVPPSMEA